MPEQQTIEDLGRLVKEKYGNAYGSMPDAEVGARVKAKYPQYSQFADIRKQTLPMQPHVPMHALSTFSGPLSPEYLNAPRPSFDERHPKLAKMEKDHPILYSFMQQAAITPPM